MEKLNMHTKDFASVNAEKLAQLFPECVTEASEDNGEIRFVIDFDKLKQILATEVVEGTTERYQFTWPDKKNAIRIANSPTNMTLRPSVEESVNFNNTENLYIEGDNLEVLKLLRENYLGKVKTIYIDPPYNTGNDFIYHDNYSQTSSKYLDESGQLDEEGFQLVQNTENNGRFHSDWLNMIYPRIRVAKDLLQDGGVLFVSIDEHEISNLKRVCDEIFGKDNCVETIVWKNKYGAGAKTVGFISVHEYILCYVKGRISNVTCELEGDSLNMFNKRDEKFDERGPYMTQPLMTNSLGDRPNLMYTIEYKGETIVPRKQWVWEKERLLKAIQNNEVEFSKKIDGTYSVRSKYYLKDENGNIRRGKPLSLLNGPFNQEGTTAIRDLFCGKSVFDFTKPPKLIEYLLSLQFNDQDNNDGIILDFFSGSSTTAHAIMNLNLKDGGRRRFIMIQVPEAVAKETEAYKAGYKNICEIGKERIRRAGKRILEEQEKSESDCGLFAQTESKPKVDIGFRVLKLDSSNMQDVYYRPEESDEATLFEDNIKPDRTPEDLLFQVMLECNLPLSAKIETINIAGKEVFSVNNSYLIACFDTDVNEEVIKAVAKMKPYYFIMRDSSLSSDNVADNFDQIFQAYSKETIRRVL